jgi:ActR/RegA family two-component response regulator
MNDQILFVDDEPVLLDTMRRLMGREFKVTTAPGGHEGLAVIREQGSFAVVVSDLRMPGKDGIAFLTKVREIAPDAVRVMLTGFGDLTAAVNAVNEGQIFRFLQKPCQYEHLAQTMRAGLEQYRLVRAERELLEDTLAGSVQVLTEILAVVNPGAFGRATRVRTYMAHLARELDLTQRWQFELAGLLSMVGCVAVPSEVLSKMWAEQPLTDSEERVFSSHPALARTLLKRIPRLETVSQIIGAQLDPPVPIKAEESPAQSDTTALGTAMLRVALALDQRLVRGETLSAAITALRRKPDLYLPRLVQALETVPLADRDMQIRACAVADLEVGMILDEEVRTKTGTLLATKGHQVTPALLACLRNFARGVGVVQPFRVLAAAQDASRRAA